MQLISLAEFRRCLSLSEKSLVWLLEHNSLAIHLDSTQGIMIDIEATDVRTLVRAIAARKAEIVVNSTEELTERVGALLAESLEELLEEALSLATARGNRSQLTCQEKGKTGQ